MSMAHLTAVTALENSHRAPSPMSLIVRPPDLLIRGSKSSSRNAFNRRRVSSSRRLIMRLKPTTSAANMADNLRSTPSAVKIGPPPRQRIRLIDSHGHELPLFCGFHPCSSFRDGLRNSIRSTNVGSDTRVDLYSRHEQRRA